MLCGSPKYGKAQSATLGKEKASSDGGRARRRCIDVIAVEKAQAVPHSHVVDTNWKGHLGSK